jgi:nanoRNase/pAp phosphatase (c-di-AMP/oligoRNAs hydrolase)
VAVSQKKKFIFTDIDLDGAMCYLLFLWFNKKYIPYIPVGVKDFKSSFSKWLEYHNLKKYDHVYLLDLDTSQDSIDLVDNDKIIIIDHHSTHVENKHKYKRANVFVEEISSCSMHVYNLLRKKCDVKLTAKQKHLLLLVDDYDCYNLALQGSHELNLLFWNYQGDRIAKFVKEFQHGFSGFDDKQKDIITFYKNRLNKVTANLDVYTSNVPIGQQTYKFVSTFASEGINEVADYIIKTNNADIGMVINLQSKRVSFRKDKAVDVDLSKLAGKLAQGGGHKYAAGGLLTDNVLSLSKMFRIRRHSS